MRKPQRHFVHICMLMKVAHTYWHFVTQATFGRVHISDQSFKRLLNAWQLTEAETKDLRQWRNSAHERFEALQSLAPTDPRTLSKGKKEKTTKRPNSCLNKLMDTTDLLIPTTSFARLGRGVLAEVAPEKKNTISQVQP
ncbi:hypothetical protein CEXT_665191 [Caerostris extrusa]|uniref:Uncharacterized protein n=1 Tax=Caerostris extrusa TaxID=172846 RepID=A0AAV4RK40_CAEEX|nr:hypothetical protein CEXT_665191 [Caerostris extrusa]